MQKTNFKRILSFLTAVSMVMSMVILPAAAEEETDHTHDYTQETIVTEATCGIAGSKKLSCTCSDFIEEGIPATGEHNYDQGVCTVCGAEKPCNGTADCDAPTHTSCLSQCDLHTSCPSDVHKEGCLKDAPCTCIQACSENLACPVCQDNGTCTGAIAAENIARVQALIDALPASYNLSQEAQMKAQYDACTAAINGLQEHERAALNLTKYTAAATPTIIDNVNVAFIGQTGYPTLEAAIAASLLFRREGEEPMSPETILTTVSGFSADDAVYKRIMNLYDMLVAKQPLSAILAKIKAERNSAVIV